jgi:hypothetical protein
MGGEAAPEGHMRTQLPLHRRLLNTCGTHREHLIADPELTACGAGLMSQGSDKAGRLGALHPHQMGQSRQRTAGLFHAGLFHAGLFHAGLLSTSNLMWTSLGVGKKRPLGPGIQPVGPWMLGALWRGVRAVGETQHRAQVCTSFLGQTLCAPSD